MYLYVLTNQYIMIGQYEPLISPRAGYTRIFFKKCAFYVPHRTRSHPHVGVRCALLRRRRALYYVVVVLVVLVVVVVVVVVRCHAHGGGGGVRHTASLTTARTHTHPDTVVVVVVVSPRIAGLRHSRHTVVIAHRHSFIHSFVETTRCRCSCAGLF